MGRPKALLDFDGKCCLQLVLEAVRGLGAPIAVLGAVREEIQARIDLGSTQVVLNDNWRFGQTSSLKAGLSRLPPDATAFLLYPVDYPLVTTVDVGRLAEALLLSADPEKMIFIPRHGGRNGHPVLCRRALAREFLALPDDGSARSVTKADPQRIHHVDFDQPYLLMDLDTPEDYAACLEAYRSRERGRG